MYPKDDYLEMRKFESVLSESIKTSALLNFKGSMEFYLRNWLPLCRTDPEREFIQAQVVKILDECGQSEWAAEISKERGTSPQPSPLGSASHTENPDTPTQKEATIPEFQGYLTPEGLLLFDEFLKAKQHFLNYQNQLYNFFLNNRERDEAEFRLELMFKLAYFPREYALYWLKRGALMEGDRNYSDAVEAYREGVEHEQDNPEINYFLRNNLGYSLNQLGQFSEGEAWCREAIEIDWNRPNAHKNLGLALIGQGRYPEAAESLQNATVVNPFDQRALYHLQELLETHPDLGVTHPEYREFLDKYTGGRPPR